MFSSSKWSGRQYARLEEEAAGLEFGAPADDFARRLLREHGREEYAVHWAVGKADCDFIQKRIRPNMLWGRDGVFALYGAAHEVGHAVVGPHFWSADVRWWRAAWLVWIAGSFAGGLLGLSWLPVVLWFLPASGALLSWRSEAKASAWAVKALSAFRPARPAIPFFERRCRADEAWQGISAIGRAACFAGMGFLLCITPVRSSGE